MTGRNQETGSHMIPCDRSGELYKDMTAEVTTGMGEQVEAFSLYGVSDPISQAKKLLSKIEDERVAKQVGMLLTVVRSFVEAVRSVRTDLRYIPPLHAYEVEDGAVLLEWVFPDFRVGFNIEPKQEESGWHFLSNERLGDVAASGQLTNAPEIVSLFIQFVLPNI